MRVVLDPAAAAELREAAVFYEDCREGLGQEFLASVEAAFDAIVRRPTLWRRLKAAFVAVWFTDFRMVSSTQSRTASCTSPR